MKKIRKSWSLIILILLVIVSILFLLKGQYPKAVNYYCDRQAENKAILEAKKKGFTSESDTYYVVYIMTKTNEKNRCLYKFGLTDTSPNDFNFNWLPDLP